MLASRTLALHLVGLGLALALTACSGGQTSEPPASLERRDSGTVVRLDSGVTSPDAGPNADAGSNADAAQPDAALAPDAEPSLDAEPSVDAAAPDAEGPDASQVDTGALDAAATDTGAAPDAATPIPDASAALDAATPLPDAGPGPDASAPDASPVGTVLVLAGGPSGVLAAELGSNGWTTTALGDGTTDAPAIAAGGGSALGVIRSTANGGELRTTSWLGAGSFTALTAIGPAITTRATPAIAGGAAGVSLAFHGDDYHHYFAAYAGTWSPAAEPVTPPSNVPSFGPTPAGIALLGADAVIAYAGNDGDLYDQTRSAGAWQEAHAHLLGPNSASRTPSIIALDGGAELMIAFVRASDARIVFTTRTAGTWSAPAAIDTNAFSNDPVALAPIPGGGAVLAYRGQDGYLYWSRYLGGTWSAPSAVFTPNEGTPSRPAIAPGVGGHAAELVWVGSDGAAHHSRLSGPAWSAPTVVGGTALTGVAVTTRP